MFGGLLAFLGIYAGSAAKAAYDNYDMKKTTRRVDENGNVHYMDRLCNDYINGERVKRVETTDRNGVKLYSTVGVNSSKVYDTSYGRGTQQLFAMSEHDKQENLKYGKMYIVNTIHTSGKLLQLKLVQAEQLPVCLTVKIVRLVKSSIEYGISVQNVKESLITILLLMAIWELKLQKKNLIS